MFSVEYQIYLSIDLLITKVALGVLFCFMQQKINVILINRVLEFDDSLWFNDSVSLCHYAINRNIFIPNPLETKSEWRVWDLILYHQFALTGTVMKLILWWQT